LAAFKKNRQYLKFCLYGFLKNLRFFDAFLLIFFLENDRSFSQIGLLYASREVAINLLEIPSGIIADTYGRKYALLGSFLLYMIAFAVFFWSTPFLWMLIAMILMGVGDAFRSGAHKGMIMDYLKLNHWDDQKIEYYGRTRSWSQRGSAVSALLAGTIVFFSGNYRIIYLISILPYLLNFINVYTYPDEINHPVKDKKQRKSLSRGMISNFIRVIKRRKVLELVNSSALHSAYLKSIKDYIQPLIVQVALLLPLLSSINVKSSSGLIIGITYFFIYLLTSYASRNAGRLAELGIGRLEKKTLLLGLGLGLCCGLLYMAEGWWLALLLFVSVYLVENLRKPILTGFITDHVPNEMLTSVISAESFYKTIMTAGLSLLLGILADYWGIGIALCGATSLLLLLTLTITLVAPSKAPSD
jgi:MFS family permease